MANFTYLNIHAGAYDTTSAVDTTGAKLIILYACDGTVPTVSDNKSNTWTPLTTESGGGTNGRMFFCFNPTVGSGHTFSVGTSDGTILMEAFSVTDTPVADQHNENTASGTSIQPGSITPSVDNELVICGLGMGNGTGPTINGGFTKTDSKDAGVNFGGGIAYLIQTTATAANPTWSWTTSGQEVCNIQSFKNVVATTTGGAFLLNFL